MMTRVEDGSRPGRLLCLLCIVASATAALAQPSTDLAPRSPCPDIFKYDSSNPLRLSGTLKIEYPAQPLNYLEVEVSLVTADPGDKENGHLTMADDDQSVTNFILNGRPVYFYLTFPKYIKTPKVTKVSKNGKVICSGEKYGIYPAQTTRYIKHFNNFTITGGQFENNNNNKPPIQSFFTTTAASTTSATPAWTLPPTRAPSSSMKKTKRPIFTLPVTPKPSSSSSSSSSSSAASSAQTIPSIRPEDISNYEEDEDDQDQGFRTPNDAQCGVSSPSTTLAIGGAAVHKGKYPWLVALYVRSNAFSFDYKCVANLIGKKHVITAAHCTLNGRISIPNKDFVLAAGIHDLQTLFQAPDVQYMGVRRTIVHAMYEDNKGDADLAIMELAQDVTYGFNVKPICLLFEQASSNFWGRLEGVVAGWNLEDAHKSTVLPKEVTIPVVTNEECASSDSRFKEFISERTFCAGKRDDTGPCNGESGSGFVIQINKKWFLRGMVASSLRDAKTGNCDLKNYVLFTDVTKYSRWVQQMLSLK